MLLLLLLFFFHLVLMIVCFNIGEVRSRQAAGDSPSDLGGAGRRAEGAPRLGDAEEGG